MWKAMFLKDASGSFQIMFGSSIWHDMPRKLDVALFRTATCFWKMHVYLSMCVSFVNMTWNSKRNANGTVTNKARHMFERCTWIFRGAFHSLLWDEKLRVSKSVLYTSGSFKACFFGNMTWHAKIIARSTVTVKTRHIFERCARILQSMVLWKDTRGCLGAFFVCQYGMNWRENRT